MIYHTYIPRLPLSQFVKFLWLSEGDNLPLLRVNLLPIGSIAQIVEREIWMQEGCNWLQYQKSGRIITEPGFLTKLEEIGVKNCQNVYSTTIPAV